MATAVLLPAVGRWGTDSGQVETRGGFRREAHNFCTLLQKCAALHKKGEWGVRAGGGMFAESVLVWKALQWTFGYFAGHFCPHVLFWREKRTGNSFACEGGKNNENLLTLLALGKLEAYGPGQVEFNLEEEPWHISRTSPWHAENPQCPSLPSGVDSRFCSPFLQDLGETLLSRQA